MICLRCTLFTCLLWDEMMGKVVWFRGIDDKCGILNLCFILKFFGFTAMFSKELSHSIFHVEYIKSFACVFIFWISVQYLARKFFSYLGLTLHLSIYILQCCLNRFACTLSWYSEDVSITKKKGGCSHFVMMDL